MAGGSVRRNPTLPGTAALTRADFDDWRASRITLDDLANRVGVSAPAVSKYFRRWKRESSAASADASAPAAGPLPKPAGPASAADSIGSPSPPFTSNDALILLKSAAIATLVRSHAALVAPGSLGASQLKALGVAIKDAGETLIKTGVLDLSEIEGDRLKELRVRVLTEAEELEIRRRAEAPDDDDLDSDTDSGGNDTNAPAASLPPAAGG